MAELSGSFLPPLTDAFPVELAADMTVQVSVWLKRKATDLPDAATGPISRSELGAKWGADKKDADSLLAYLQGVDKNIKAVDTPLALERRLVSFSGPLKSLADAFGATVRRVQLPGGAPFLMRTGSLTVPDTLKDIVLGVFGLDQRPVGGPVTTAASSIDPKDLPTPVDIATRYKFPSNKGKNQTIALMQFGGGYAKSDLDTYFTGLGLSTPTLTDRSVLGAVNTPGSAYDKEVTLDIEVAGAVANESRFCVYFAPLTEAGWIQAISTAVFDTTYPIDVMSISWGAPEMLTSHTLTWTKSGMWALHWYFFDAALLGITVLAASGDDGSNCLVGDGMAHVYYPASDPLVLACGGTTIADWIFDPACEIAWALGGGGISDISDICAVPAYQAGLDLPLSRNTMGTARGVPDVAGYADPGYAFLIKNHTIVLTGTSLVTPLYAGAVARLNVKIGKPTGLLHPVIYKSPAAYCRDIDDAVSNGTSNGVGGAPGYYGRTGWDARTGLGVFQPGP